MPNLFQPGKKKNKKKKFKNGMPEGLENDGQSSENDHWNEASGEWTDEPQETFVQMTLQEPQQLRTNTASQQTRKQQPEKTTASVYTKSAEELQEIMLWSEILGEPAAVRRRKRKVNQQYGDQSNAYRR